MDRLRFGVCGCSHYETGYFTGYRRIAEEQFDFVFHSGDYIYEGRADGGRNPNVVRQHQGPEIYSIVDYRNRYALYKSDPDLMAAHASAPFLVSYDDHEVDNDYAGDLDEQGTPSELFLLRRAAAYQAYFEMMPLRRSALPTGNSMRLYRRIQFGGLIDLSVLDTRQYRSKQACGGGSKTDCAEALAADRTILGAAQEKWLFDNLAAAKSRWTVLAQQVPTFARDFKLSNPAGRYSMDKWDGYAASRSRLFARLKETRAPNPVVLSGDVHLHYGSDLEARLHQARLGNRRHRIHQHIADVGRRWRRRLGRLGKDEVGQPPHQVPQRQARLHRVYRNARPDARGLQDPRQGHGAEPACQDRRLARGRGRKARRPNGLGEGSDLFLARLTTGVDTRHR